MSNVVTCLGVGIAMWCQVPDPPKPTVIVCPPVIEWRAADQNAAALELDKLPAGHPLRTMATVITKQRDVNRACIKAKP